MWLTPSRKPGRGHDVEDGAAGDAGQRVGAVAARRRRGLREEAVVPQLSRRGHPAQRVPAADRLAEHEDVRPHREPVDREVAPQPAEAGDRLVDDEKPAAAVAELAQAGEEAPLRRAVAGGAEDRLHDDRGDAVEGGGAAVERGQRVGPVLVALGVVQRVVLLAARVRERVHPVDAQADPLLGEAPAAEAHAGGLAVEPARERDEVAATAHRLGEAHRDLDSLGATGVQRHAVDAGGQHGGEPLQVRGVLGGVQDAGGQPVRLRGHGIRPHRVAVTDGGDAHGRGEVEQALAAVGDEVRALTVGHDQARPTRRCAAARRRRAGARCRRRWC